MLSTLSSLDFFQSNYQSITKMLSLLELTVITREMRCKPVLLDCVRFSLLPLTVLETELAAIAQPEPEPQPQLSAIATDTTATATATNTTATTAIATDTTAITTSSYTDKMIADDFQLAMFQSMTNHLFFQQSWKVINDLSSTAEDQGYLSDRIESSVWLFNKVLPIYYDTKNSMIIVKLGSVFYGCIAGWASVDGLKWDFAHNVLYNLKHNPTAIAVAIATANDAVIAATDAAIATIKTETEANRALSKFQKLWYLQQIDYPEIEQLKGIASINAAITSVSTFMSAHKAVTNHAVPKKDPNKKSAKSDTKVESTTAIAATTTKVESTTAIAATTTKVASTTSDRSIVHHGDRSTVHHQ